MLQCTRASRTYHHDASRYTPARDALVKAWRERSKKSRTVAAVDDVAAVILRAMELLNGQPLQKGWAIWTSNCGRGVSRHMGPHDFPKRMGLLRETRTTSKRARKSVNGVAAKTKVKAKVKAKVKSNLLWLVKSGRPYAKCRLTDRVRDILHRHVKFGIAMAKCKALECSKCNRGIGTRSQA